jgi:TetR/AcrR family transcriptional repressor of nem operon
MVRYKEYDRLEVLDKAVSLFWEKGYKASSMTDIVHATGLNTASMYKEFGDKDGLFEEALEHYRDNVVSHRFDILIDQPDTKGIEAFLKNVVSGALREEYRGCLMMNHLAQKHSISAHAAILVSDFCAKMERLLEIAIRNGQTNGEIPCGREPALLASFLMCCVHGLVLYARHPGKKEDVAKLQDVFLAALRN